MTTTADRPSETSATQPPHPWLPTSALLEQVRATMIGDDTLLSGPYGPRRMVYADHTASGRASGLVEDAIRAALLPTYANTHTESSLTGHRTTVLRDQARSAVRAAIGAGDDVLVLFTGSGSTGAVDKMVRLLGLRIPAELDDRYHLSERIPPQERPVVFVGPFEHHSNELPWRESIADVVEIPASPDGHIDLAALEEALRRHASRPLRIGTFSAASNVTGIRTDTAAITALLHRYGALAFWDYAAAGPYVEIAMDAADPARRPAENKDAVFLSPHKFIGGPGSPGVLAVRRTLVHNRVPTVPGGGTVAYVSADSHRYLDDPILREEGGTPDIVGSVRAGLAFQLKQAIGVELIEARERALVQRAMDSWRARPQLRVLGNTECPRLGIIAFTVAAPPRVADPQHATLHHNFVTALLNDLFGVQTRGGCSCAGPYGHQLLGIDPEHSHRFLEEIVAGFEGLKPGWTRAGLHYTFSETVAEYVIEAIGLVAEHGWKLLGDYDFDVHSGLWRHLAAPEEPPAPLFPLRLDAAGLVVLPETPAQAGEDTLAAQLEQARRLLVEHPPIRLAGRLEGVPAEAEALRWFPLPG